MQRVYFHGVAVLCAMLLCGSTSALAVSPTPASAQSSAAPETGSASGEADAGIGSDILEWTPAALTQLGSQALANENFTFDRMMLAAAAGLLPDTDADVKQAVAKLDGVSVHMLRFAAPGTVAPAQIGAIREAYHQRGWKHIMSSSSLGDPAHGGISDVWLLLDGVNIRGAAVMVESPKSLTLATMAGNLSPLDLLHLRGHFGIPRFDSDGLNGETNK